MTDNPPHGQVLATLAATLPSLTPAEQAVARQLLNSPAESVELNSQELAERAGTSRATAVRVAQRLGFAGYTQLRVAIAKEHDPAQVAVDPRHRGVGDSFAQTAAAADSMAALLNPEDAEKAVGVLAAADRLLVIGNGLSAGLALDTAARFNSIGRHAEHVFDPISQQVCAGQLGDEDAVLICSGSGAHHDSVRVAEIAHQAQAQVIALTSCRPSPIASRSDICLVVGMPGAGFADELSSTSRVPQAILCEALVQAVAEERGSQSGRAKRTSLGLVAEHLED
ncbi:MurR/RpiR family transcriptional regulator [Propionibacterium sp.]|uniref:MurR/RpiR family transcriptional regulator n=1 Tax=Propionibacterium sp. TaxID=1977903 RepID=UPI0039E9B589